VATQITATGPRSRPAQLPGVLVVALLAIIAVVAIGVGALATSGSVRDVTTDGQAYSARYPLHGGLAGPSRVGQVSTVDLSGHYAPGYAFHGGLAGPSRGDSGD